MMNNPFDFSRTMMETWEKSMAEALERLTRDQEFIKHMSQAVGGALDIRRQSGEQMEKYLRSINMPTRSDLERLLGYLQRIESKLLDLEDRLDEMAVAGGTAPSAASQNRGGKPAGSRTATKASPNPKKRGKGGEARR